MGRDSRDGQRCINVHQRPLSPLFRWAGGKRWLVPEILSRIPSSYRRYYEPFVGGGALFFALRPKSAHLADLNPEIAGCYRQLRDNAPGVEARLRALPHDSETYYRLRSSTPRTEHGRAARFIYLTTLAWNGLYRVNRHGQFNVPYGGREYPHLREPAFLAPYGEALAQAEIAHADFEEALEGARARDLVYLDPPYTVAHGNNGFLKYNDRMFSWRDQERLASVAKALSGRGCFVFVSSAAHSSVLELYRGTFRVLTLDRHSVISGKNYGRRPVREFLFTNV